MKHTRRPRSRASATNGGSTDRRRLTAKSASTSAAASISACAIGRRWASENASLMRVSSAGAAARPGDTARRPGREARLDPGARALGPVGAVGPAVHRVPGSRASAPRRSRSARPRARAATSSSFGRYGPASRNIGSVRFVSRKNTSVHFGRTPLGTTKFLNARIPIGRPGRVLQNRRDRVAGELAQPVGVDAPGHRVADDDDAWVHLLEAGDHAAVERLPGARALERRQIARRAIVGRPKGGEDEVPAERDGQRDGARQHERDDGGP